MRRTNMPPGESGFNALFSRYKYCAKNRGHAWNLDKELFRDLTSQPCHYCKTPPSQTCFSGSKNKISAEAHEHSAYVYNGIDRVDNAIGYEPSNVVPCCKTCNMAKFKMTSDEYANWLDIAKAEARVSSLTIEELPGVLKTMREGGVQEFSYLGLSVKFQPDFGGLPQPSLPANYMDELNKEEKNEAVERSKRAAEDYQSDLLWSA